MKIVSILLAAGVIALSFVGCKAGSQVATSGEVIKMKQSGTTDIKLLQWVREPTRTFDLTDTDIADLAAAGVSEDIISAMVVKSDKHHEEKGHTHEHGHEH